MARRRRAYKKRVKHSFAHYVQRGTSGTGGLLATLIGAALYGAVRQRASDAVMPLAAKLPFGNISDEVALGGSAILLDRFIGRKMPMIKPFLKGALIVEGARIGEAIATNQVYATSSSGGNIL